MSNNWDGLRVRPFSFGGAMDYNKLRMAVIRNDSDTYMADCFRRAFNVPTADHAPRRPKKAKVRDRRYDGARKLMRQRIGALDR